jgi:hypothetical protein
MPTWSLEEAAAGPAGRRLRTVLQTAATSAAGFIFRP